MQIVYICTTCKHCDPVCLQNAMGHITRNNFMFALQIKNVECYQELGKSVF